MENNEALPKKAISPRFNAFDQALGSIKNIIVHYFILQSVNCRGGIVKTTTDFTSQIQLTSHTKRRKGKKNIQFYKIVLFYLIARSHLERVREKKVSRYGTEQKQRVLSSLLWKLAIKNEADFGAIKHRPAD